MRALQTVSGSWSVVSVPEPEPGPGEVVVDVVAAGLNHADLMARDGSYVPDDASWRRVPAGRVGFELAGRVSAAGAGVTTVAVGDEVVAQTGGGCAERVVVDARLLIAAPVDRSWVERAAMPCGLLTEHDALTGPGRFRPGDRVLVLGATTGVGSLGVQVAQALRAGRVAATTRKRERVDALRALGADDVLVTPEDLTGPPSYDVVLDHLGGEALAAALPLVVPRGRVVQVGRLAGARAELDLGVLSKNRLTLVGTTFRGRDMDELASVVAAVRESGVAERVRPVIDTVLDLADAEEAAERLAAPDLDGKVVLRIG